MLERSCDAENGGVMGAHALLDDALKSNLATGGAVNSIYDI